MTSGTFPQGVGGLATTSSRANRCGERSVSHSHLLEQRLSLGGFACFHGLQVAFTRQLGGKRLCILNVWVMASGIYPLVFWSSATSCFRLNNICVERCVLCLLEISLPMASPAWPVWYISSGITGWESVLSA